MKTRNHIATLVAAAAAAWLFATGTQAAIVTFQEGDGGAFSATNATWIEERYPTTPHGSQNLLSLEEEYRTTTHLLFQGLVGFFDIVGPAAGQIPAGSTINSATLTMWPTTATNSGGGAAGVALHQMLVPWNEATATWSSFGNGPFVATVGAPVNPGGGAPGVDYATPVIDSKTVSDGTDPSVWTVTSTVQNWANGDLNAGFYLLFRSTNGITLDSDDVATPATRPLLTVDFTPAGPPTPAVVSVSIGNTSQNPPTTSTPVLLPTDVAGVVPVANWNEFDGSNPSVAAGMLVNDAGVVVPGLAFSAVGNQNTYNYGGSTGDLKLMSSFLSETASLQITGIPFASYDLYLYTDPFSQGNITEFTVNGTLVKTATDSGIFIAGQTFIEGDNYLLFSGLSGPNVLVTLNNTTPGITHFQGLQGFQIVEAAAPPVPEPSTCVLAALGLLGLVLCGRRARRT